MCSVSRIDSEISEESFVSKDITWKIQNVFQLPKSVNFMLESPKFSFADGSWCLRIYPNQQTEQESKNHVALGLVRLCSSVPKQKVFYKLGFKTRHGEEFESFSGSGDFSDSEVEWEVVAYLESSELHAKKDKIAPNDTLTVFCKVRSQKHPTTEAGTQTDVATTIESFGTLLVCIVGDVLKENASLIQSIEKLDLPIVCSSSRLEFINQGAEFTTIYILEEFEGELYTSLLRAGQRILGPTTVMQYAERKEHLPNNIRPLYTISMKNCVISFTGFRVKEELSAMVDLIHHMGGSVRKEFKIGKATHLIATPNATSGEKCKSAAASGIPIMTAQWVHEVWARRHDVSCNATDGEFMQYKLLPFVGCEMAFVGYQIDEEEHTGKIPN